VDFLSRYFYAQQVAFEKNYPLIGDRSELEAIHDIRVSIKKLRSLFKLIGFITPERFNIGKSYKPFRRIFKKLGFTRDIQVQREILNFYEDQLDVLFGDYSLYLRDLEEEQRDKIEHWIKNYRFPDWKKFYILIWDIVGMEGQSLIIKKANDYIDNKLNEIKDLLPAEDNKTLHLIRRLLKEIRYVIDCIVNLSTEDNEYSVLHKNIKLIEDDLGNWHDRVVAARFISDFSHTYKIHDQDISTDYDRLNDLIRKENQVYLDQAKDKLNKVLVLEQYYE